MTGAAQMTPMTSEAQIPPQQRAQPKSQSLPSHKSTIQIKQLHNTYSPT